VQHVFGTRNLRQLASTGHVIGMQMSIDDVPNLQTILLG
jgi:hypothetical protein